MSAMIFFSAIIIFGIIYLSTLNISALNRLNVLENKINNNLSKEKEDQKRGEYMERTIFLLNGAIQAIAMHLQRLSPPPGQYESFGDQGQGFGDQGQGFEEEDEPQEIQWLNEFIEKHGRAQINEISKDDPLKKFFGES